MNSSAQFLRLHQLGTRGKNAFSIILCTSNQIDQKIFQLIYKHLGNEAL